MGPKAIRVGHRVIFLDAIAVVSWNDTAAVIELNTGTWEEFRGAERAAVFAWFEALVENGEIRRLI